MLARRTVEELARRYSELVGSSTEPLGDGLINETYRVTSPGGERFVLQRVNPIFDRRIHDNIEVVTRCLEGAGLVTPRLVLTGEGELSADLGDEAGLYRLMTYVDGHCFNTVETVGQTRSAGRLVGRFHRALDALDRELVGLRLGVHDTDAHLARLRDALASHGAHRLHDAVAPLGEEILRRASELPNLPALPERACHGDLKLNNILFAGRRPPESERALCLIDLDTLGPMRLAHELGDAWRSWCNRAGEDVTEGSFDLDVFEASLGGYREGIERSLDGDEREALLLGPEWVSLELAARFAADALLESYFGWDRRRFPAAGEHNLVRAQGQLALHRAIVETRDAREVIVSSEA